MEKNKKLHDLIIQTVDSQLEEGEPETTVIANKTFQKMPIMMPNG